MKYLEEDFEKLFTELHDIRGIDYPLNEAQGDLTLYDLRAFYSVMAETTTDGKLKEILKSMIKTIAKMEVFKRKIPPIMKVKSPSPTIRKYTRN